MNHTRHMGLFVVPSGFSVTIVGAGGIGAITALTLAKMGVRTLEIWDDDEVSEENLATQLHKCRDVGNPKAPALLSTLQEFSDDIMPYAHLARVNSNTVLRSSLVISAVDSIQARQDVWQALLNPESHWGHYQDMRMAAQEYQHFLVPAADTRAVSAYDRKLTSMREDDVPEVACTEKATFFTAMTAAGHAGKVLRDIVRDEAKPHRLVHYIPNNCLLELPY